VHVTTVDELPWAIATDCVFVAALKFAVAAPLALTTQAPALLELNVDPLIKAHGPLTTLYVSAELSVFVVVALTEKLPPPNVGVGAVAKVIVGVVFVVVTVIVNWSLPSFQSAGEAL